MLGEDLKTDSDSAVRTHRGGSFQQSARHDGFLPCILRDGGSSRAVAEGQRGAWCRAGTDNTRQTSFKSIPIFFLLHYRFVFFVVVVV